MRKPPSKLSAQLLERPDLTATQRDAAQRSASPGLLCVTLLTFKDQVSQTWQHDLVTWALCQAKEEVESCHWGWCLAYIAWHTFFRDDEHILFGDFLHQKPTTGLSFKCFKFYHCTQAPFPEYLCYKEETRLPSTPQIASIASMLRVLRRTVGGPKMWSVSMSQAHAVSIKCADIKISIAEGCNQITQWSYIHN